MNKQKFTASKQGMTNAALMTELESKIGSFNVKKKLLSLLYRADAGDMYMSFSQIAEQRGLIGVTQLSTQCGVPSSFIQRLATLHNIKGEMIGARRWFTPEQADEIKKLVAAHTANKVILTQSQKRKKLGLRSTLDVARAVGVAPITINWHMKRGHIPTPTHPCELYPAHIKFWTLEEAKKVCAWLEANMTFVDSKRKRIPL